ncbi:glycosyl hydrolase, putative [Rhizoctonia solani AG-1 IA]|uniref:beta-glucosidase n=1 Tax=Thanatephorus cucumeris (strain AG1-IA) TaxID=983506 RepID=L8X6K6_THACA|nr:glycosyl hydrolase, putative [Rhizoctonia solani AG-1 IA]
MTANNPFLHINVEELVSKLSQEEKIRLLGAPNWWNTNKIDRLGVPSVRMSDGPNGVRGSSHFLSSPAQCIPCATALGSTFDPELIHEVGSFLAVEAKSKSATVLLAPTCNIQRSPLGGRSFESFSEDPHLSGHLAAAYVSGLQDNGVAATIKHYVANDQEHERMAVDTILSERALREIYLMPFMIAQRDAGPWAYMTAWVLAAHFHGTHVSECKRLLDEVLRKEWGFNGLVMSDWYGTYSVDIALNAGLDLEMPGPPRWRQPALVNHALTSRKLLPSTLDLRAKTVLDFVQKLAKTSPDVVFGDGEERTRDDPKDREFNRKLAGRAIVLLKNQEQVLPLKKKNVLVVGPNAQARVISGGGSAFLKPSYVITPWDGIIAAKPKDVDVKFEVGCYGSYILPSAWTTPDGEAGWEARFYTHDENQQPKDEVAKFVLNDTRVKLNDFLPEGLTSSWTIKLKGTLKVDKTAPFEFGLTVAGRAKLWVNGKMTIDNWTHQRPGEFFYGQGSAEEKAVVDLKAGEPVDIYVEYDNLSPAPKGVQMQPRLGGAEKIDPEEALKTAAKAAAEVDAVIAVVGLNHEWESEGFDRPTLSLPGRQDELIKAVGSAVSMPWADDVTGILQGWYLGNEAGNAIADVLFGKVNPSGRLPISLPKREEDIPAHLSFGSEMGKVHYREDVFVGYKYYQARKVAPLFPFGRYGLSYTTFELSDLKVEGPSSHDSNLEVSASITVKNTGSVKGSETVQLYVSRPIGPITHPKLELRAFGKAADLEPGASTTVKLSFGKYGVSFWHEEDDTWRADAGEYSVLVGTSSVDLPLSASFKLKQTFSWRGL